MSIRFPLKTVLDVTNTDAVGAGSVAGGYAYPFVLPQDTDNVVVKFTPSVTAGGASVIFQTSDDGGTTYYDVARTSIASNSGATAVTGANAQWLSIPVVGVGYNPNAVSAAQVGSVTGGSTGSAGASTLASRQMSGLPILSPQNRIFMIMTGDNTANTSRIKVMCNSQSATA